MKKWMSLIVLTACLALVSTFPALAAPEAETAPAPTPAESNADAEALPSCSVEETLELAPATVDLPATPETYRSACTTCLGDCREDYQGCIAGCSGAGCGACQTQRDNCRANCYATVC